MLLVTLAAPIVILLAAEKRGPALKHYELPPYGLVYDTQELSRISFSCSFLDGRGEITQIMTDKLRCDFLQALLTMPSTEEVTRRLGKEDEDFEAGWKENLSKEPLTEMKKLCGKPEDKQFQDAERQRLQSNRYAAALLPALERSQRAHDRLCSCADKTCFHDALKAYVRQEARDDAESCQINTNAWKIEFRRSGEAWVSVGTREALFHCYSSVTATLSRAKNVDSKFWDMRTVKVPNPNADSQFCTKTLQDNTDSWRGYGVIALTCRSLKL